MKDNDIDNLIGRLQGFDDEELQQTMTDGLDRWCQSRADRARRLRLVAGLALLLLTSTALAMTVVPQWRPAFLGGGKPTVTPPPAPQPKPCPQTALADTAVNAPVKHTATVDYTYFGRSEDGYSITYGVDSRTLVYTRREGNRLIRSVMHNVPDSLFIDTTPTNPAPQSVDTLTVAPDTVAYDFQTVTPHADTFYCTIVDSASLRVSIVHVSPRGDTLVLPASVEYEGQRYPIESLADKAILGHNLRCVVAQAEVPCKALPSSFVDLAVTALLIVPCRAADAYDAAPYWGSSFNYNIEEDCVYEPEQEVPMATVTVGRGSISVSGSNGEWYVYNEKGILIARRYTDCTVTVNRPGVYIVQIGDQPLQRVVVSF
ncbi:MAG: hypothetical protein K6E96_09190 [Bacteroidales bacterium]|nr:hypothetical protein [Bacteroidales bacterium]